MSAAKALRKSPGVPARKKATEPLARPEIGRLSYFAQSSDSLPS